MQSTRVAISTEDDRERFTGGSVHGDGPSCQIRCERGGVPGHRARVRNRHSAMHLGTVDRVQPASQEGGRNHERAIATPAMRATTVRRYRFEKLKIVAVRKHLVDCLHQMLRQPTFAGRLIRVTHTTPKRRARSGVNDMHQHQNDVPGLAANHGSFHGHDRASAGARSRPRRWIVPCAAAALAALSGGQVPPSHLPPEERPPVLLESANTRLPRYPSSPLSGEGHSALEAVANTTPGGNEQPADVGGLSSLLIVPHGGQQECEGAEDRCWAAYLAKHDEFNHGSSQSEFHPTFDTVPSGGRALAEAYVGGQFNLNLARPLAMGDYMPRTLDRDAGSMPLLPPGTVPSHRAPGANPRPVLGGGLDLITGQPLVQVRDLELPFGGSVFRLNRTYSELPAYKKLCSRLTPVPGAEFGGASSDDPIGRWWDWTGVGWMCGENPILLIDMTLPEIVGRDAPMRCYFIVDAHHAIPFEMKIDVGHYEAPPRFGASLTTIGGTWSLGTTGHPGPHWVVAPSRLLKN